MFLIFLILLLLVISILISISLILFTRHKSRSQDPLVVQNNGGNQELAKNPKKKIGFGILGCFLSSVVIIISISLFSMFLSFADMWGVFVRVPKYEMVQAVQRSYKQSGFEGTVRVLDANKNYTSFAGYLISAEYSEEIEGQTVKIGDRIEYYTSRDKKNGKTLEKGDAIYQAFPSIAYRGLELSPGYSETLQTVKDSFARADKKKLYLESLDFMIDKDAPNIDKYEALIKKNQEEGQPLQGLYPIPISDMLEKEALAIEMKVTLNAEQDDGSIINIGQDQKNDDKIKQILQEQLDLTKLSNARYLMAISVGNDSKHSGFGKYEVIVQNHQIVQFSIQNEDY
mgnify:CR=1 FL=1